MLQTDLSTIRLEFDFRSFLTQVEVGDTDGGMRYFMALAGLKPHPVLISAPFNL
ncbi:hypothetical protein [Methanosarcina sp. WWM596]|uniref:hypothetical protein n=1 Tax=Methanosarcina sp. WWM596 TaxID=1434103 RepID=UPI000AA25422|nr:hypothetical protein [Methanosarcina sp. WWM596]